MLILCDMRQMSPVCENIQMFSFDWSENKIELYVIFGNQSCYFGNITYLVPTKPLSPVICHMFELLNTS